MAEPTENLRKILKGFPEETVSACAAYQASGSDAAFDRAVLGVIAHHLNKPPKQPLAELPGTTTLVADLGLDSVTMVEMVFIFEDVFAVKIPQEELIKVSTLDDLKALVRRHVRSNL
jgi:acyl carrier protein